MPNPSSNPPESAGVPEQTQPGEATPLQPADQAKSPGHDPGFGPSVEEPQQVSLPSFDEVELQEQPPSELDLLADVNLHVKIELGRTRMLVEDVLRLREGGVVELEKLAGDPVDIYVNDRPVARGEVLVLNDNFCVRISEILDVERGTKRTA